MWLDGLIRTNIKKNKVEKIAAGGHILSIFHAKCCFQTCLGFFFYFYFFLRNAVLLSVWYSSQTVRSTSCAMMTEWNWISNQMQWIPLVCILGTVVFALVVCWVDSRWTYSTVTQKSTETSFFLFLFCFCLFPSLSQRTLQAMGKWTGSFDQPLRSILTFGIFCQRSSSPFRKRLKGTHWLTWMFVFSQKTSKEKDFMTRNLPAP